MRTGTVGGPVLTFLLSATPLTAQNVVLDRGEFEVSVDGRRLGTEEFQIRRAGLGSDGTVIASATLTFEDDGGARSIQVVLAVNPNQATARRYQVEVGGSESLDLRLSLVGRRYVSVMRSPAGEEEREFPGRPETRVLESEVAHHYYFLRGLSTDATAQAIEPRTRTRLEVRVAEITEEELLLGRSSVTARRVVFAADGDRRIVWYDRQGRVLRVEVPSRGYVAERTDLVG